MNKICPGIKKVTNAVLHYFGYSAITTTKVRLQL